MSFKDFLARIRVQQFESFKSSIQNKMERKYYLCVFLGLFLGRFPTDYEKYVSSHKKMSDADFAQYCHKIIEDTSLRNEEVDFFHAMVDIVETTNYINKCLELYHNTTGIDQCQLGGIILDCLKASKNIIINDGNNSSDEIASLHRALNECRNSIID